MTTVKRGRGVIPRSRFGAEGSYLQDTPEWRGLMKELASGLAKGEWVMISLSPETRAALPLKAPDQALYVALRRLFKGRYDVQSRTDPESGQFCVYVIGTDTEKPPNGLDKS